MNSTRKLNPIAIAALMAAPLAFAAGANVNNAQTSKNNSQYSSNDGTNNAVLENHAAAKASGNIGVNIATGSQNQQANAGALASNTIIDHSKPSKSDSSDAIA